MASKHYPEIVRRLYFYLRFCYCVLLFLLLFLCLIFHGWFTSSLLSTATATKAIYHIQGGIRVMLVSLNLTAA